MKNFSELQKMNVFDLRTMEDSFKDQESFSKLSDEEKVESFKDYLFLKVKSDSRYKEDMGESLYYDIMLGENNMDELLKTIADKVADGEDCLGLLSDDQMASDIFSNINGMSGADIGVTRQNLATSISKGQYTKLKSQVIKEKTEKVAENIRIRNAELDDVSASLDRMDEMVDENLKKNKTVEGDLDKVIADNKDALDFIDDLDKAVDQAEAEADAILERDEVEALFKGNTAAYDKRQEGRKIFERAADKVLNEEKKAKSEVDDMIDDLNEIEDEVFDKIKGDDVFIPEDEEEYKKLADSLNAAAKLKESFNTAEFEAENSVLEADEEELFPTNEKVKERVRERGHVLRPVDAPEMTLEENLKSLDELSDELEGTIGYSMRDQNDLDEFNAEIKDAEDYVASLKESEEKINNETEPVMAERNKAYAEVDRIEQIFLDQEEFEKLSEHSKKELCQSYLVNTAIITPGYNPYDLNEIKRNVNMLDVTRPLEQMCHSLKSGENIINELKSPFMQKMAYGNLLKQTYLDYTSEEDKAYYSSHIRGVAEIESSNFSKYGSYTGEITEKKKAELERRKKAKKEAEELKELFPENENLDPEAEKRIQEKKDVRSLLISEELKEQKRKDQLYEANKDAMSSYQKKLVEESAGIKEEEATKFKNMSAAEASGEMEKLEAKICDNSYFKTLPQKDKIRLAKDYLYAFGKSEPAVFGLDYATSDPEKLKKDAETLYKGIYDCMGLHNELIGLTATINDGKSFFDIVKKQDFLKCKAMSRFQKDEMFCPGVYNAEVEEKKYREAVEDATKKQKEKEAIRKSSKGFEKTYDNYITLHTGSGAGANKEELMDNLAKVCAAEKLSKSDKPFKVEEVRKAAKRLRQTYSLDVFSRLKDDSVLKSGLVDGESAVEFIDKIKDTVFKMDKKNQKSYQESMKKILDNMSKPDGRSAEYQRFYKSVKAITELNMSEDVDYKLRNLNIELYDATLAYIDGKEKVRTFEKGKKSFNNALDVLAEITKNAPGTNLSTMKVIDHINEVRKGKDTINRDMNAFTKNYGAERAADANKKKEKAKTAEAQITSEKVR
ncbi:MAG: hypothetical protein IKQ71_00360 [Lachnospiraceae bacterium]|nr:hypothetical protein [Lachnospiraceae bacterium]